jgi:hypothetical protein
MQVFEVPLSPEPQRFNITLAGVPYRLTFTWNDDPLTGGWYMNIADNSGNLIRGGIPLTTGVDLMEQFKYLEMGGGFAVQTDHDTLAAPTYENLGINSHLFFIIP